MIDKDALDIIAQKRGFHNNLPSFLYWSGLDTFKLFFFVFTMRNFLKLIF